METIGGYRLVRKLGDGERSEVFLGHSVRSEGASGPRSAAIKVFRSSVSRSDIDVEIEALARASSPHLLRLEDLATHADGRPVLVLGRLGSVSLAHLLNYRAEFTPGEAVTIVAPIALAVQELHRVGVAHSRVRLSSVRFDDTGAPVVVGFGHVTLIGAMPEREAVSSVTPAVLAESLAAMGDLVDLALLARTIVSATAPCASRARALDWLDSSEPSKSPAHFARDLSDELFDFASAEPIRLPCPIRRSTAAEEVSGVRVTGVQANGVQLSGVQVNRGQLSGGQLGGAPSSRLQPDGAEVHDEGAREAPPFPGTSRRELRRAVSSSSRPDWIAVLHMPPWLDDVRARLDLSRARSGVTAIARVLAPVRRPVWIAAGTAAVLLASALAIVPPGRDAEKIGAPSAAGAGSILESGARDPRSGEPGTGEASAILGDDPVAAGTALLAIRADCLIQRSVLCLDRVDQPGSAAWEADSYLVRQLQESTPQAPPTESVSGGEYARMAYAMALDEAAISLVDRMGNSAILTVAMPGTRPDAAPASLLLVKGEAGWRLRDLMIG